MSAEASNLRARRARHDRPCDYCRQLKHLCVIQTRDEPCVACQRRRKACTFDKEPRKRNRQRGQHTAEGGVSSSRNASTASEVENHGRAAPIGNHFRKDAGSAGDLPGQTVDLHSGREYLGSGPRFPGSLSYHTPEFMGGISEPGSTMGPHERVNSSITQVLQGMRLALDEQDACDSDDGSSAAPALDLENEDSNEESHYLGPGALAETALSPYILRNLRDHPALMDRGLKNSTGNFRQVSKDPEKPVFFVKNASLLFGKQGDGGKAVFENVQSVLGEAGLTWDEALEIFITRTLPAAPILNNIRLRGSCSSWSGAGSFPYALLSGIMIHVLIYRDDLRHLGPGLWKELLPILDDEYRHPSLRTLQLSIINLWSRPSSNHGGNAIELARAIGTAHLLGLHKDSSDWSLPRWERSVRKRLWWSLVIEDKWRALLYSRPSNLHRDRNDVPLPNDSDGDWGGFQSAEEDETGPGADQADSMQSFILMCKMASLIDGILDDFYTPTPRQVSLVGDSVQASLLKIERISGDLDVISATWPRLWEPQVRDGRLCFATGTRLAQLTLLGLRVIINKLVMDCYVERRCPSQLLQPFIDGSEEIAVLLEGFDREDCDSFWPTYAYCYITNTFSLLLQITHYASLCGANGPNQISCTDIEARALSAFRRLLQAVTRCANEHRWEVAEAALAKARLLLNLVEPMLPSAQGIQRDILASLEMRVPDGFGPSALDTFALNQIPLDPMPALSFDTLEAEQEFYSLLWLNTA